MKFIGLAFLSFSIFLTACDDPAANKPKAIASEPTASGDKIPTRGKALSISPANSKIEFTGSKVTGKHNGGFNRFDGMIDLVGENAEESRVSVEIETASVFTDTDKLTTHLQTGDFFEVEKFPKASFESTKIVRNPEGGENGYNVTGDLELRGVKKSITFPATIKIGGDQVSVNAEFAINRKDFGVLYPGSPDNLIRDAVVIRLDLKTPRK